MKDDSSGSLVGGSRFGNQPRHRGTSVNIQRVLPLRPLPEIDAYASLLSMWDRKRGYRLMPCRADFDFEDFAGWHGAIAISDVAGDDLRFRLYGTRFAEMLGVDLTGKLLCASLDESLIEQSKRHFRELIDGPNIGQTSGVVPTARRDFIEFDVLDLPLSDDGATVNRFLHVLSAALKRRT